MRIVHATDIHWFVPPALKDMTVKRLWGTLNLYALGRRHHFDPAVQDALVAHMVALRPDLVLITGDLTAQALQSEFDLALRALAPLLEGAKDVPVLILPGNHDVYTPGSVRERRFWKVFGPWAGEVHPSGLVRRDAGELTVFGLDPNRASLVGARGRLPEAQLAALEEALSDEALAGRSVAVGIHYPPIDRHGKIYDGVRHGLENAGALVNVLGRARHKPRILCCGHVHRGFQAEISLPGGAKLTVLDCGTSGQRYEPDKRRAASLGIYEIEGNRLVSIERHVHDGERFVREPGGAFSTGR